MKTVVILFLAVVSRLCSAGDSKFIQPGAEGLPPAAVAALSAGPDRRDFWCEISSIRDLQDTYLLRPNIGLFSSATIIPGKYVIELQCANGHMTRRVEATATLFGGGRRHHVLGINSSRLYARVVSWSPPDPDVIVETRDKMSAYRRSWTGNSLAILQTSAASEEERRWLLGFVALQIERQKSLESCGTPELVEIEQDVPTKFSASDSSNRVRSFAPMTYLETWTVEACGKRTTWRVFDEKVGELRDTQVILTETTSSRPK